METLDTKIKISKSQSCMQNERKILKEAYACINQSLKLTSTKSQKKFLKAAGKVLIKFFINNII